MVTMRSYIVAEKDSFTLKVGLGITGFSVL